MSNHVYYGEYSLAYWIELILTRKIVLPKYQRHFVWNKDSLKTLINTFQDNRFVPPVTIGAFCKSDGSITNYIIDGQQRLTSILLAYLDLFPDKEKYKTHLLALARGEESIDEDEGDPYDNVLEWNLSYLTEKGNNKNEICSKLEEGNYMSIGLELPNQFFHEHYLGFSYIVPDADETSQQCYYTKMFRDINVQGVQLIDIESRRSPPLSQNTGFLLHSRSPGLSVSYKAVHFHLRPNKNAHLTRHEPCCNPDTPFRPHRCPSRQALCYPLSPPSVPRW